MKCLLDYHISPRVIAALKRIGGKSELVHMRDWHGGAYVRQHGEGDLPWLRVAGREGWIIVTGDVNTLLGELVSLCDEGGPMPGFAVVASEQRSIVNGALRGVLVILVIALLGLFADDLIGSLLKKMPLERKASAARLPSMFGRCRSRPPPSTPSTRSSLSLTGTAISTAGLPLVRACSGCETVAAPVSRARRK